LVYQPNPDGVANALILTTDALDPTSMTLVLLGDLVLLGTFPEPWPTHPAVGTWHNAAPDTIRRNFGVRLTGSQILLMREKPKDIEDLVCGIGVYLLTRDIIRQFVHAPVDASTCERQITSALDYLSGTGVTLVEFPFVGEYVNVNSANDLAAAELAFSKLQNTSDVWTPVERPLLDT